VYNKFAFEEIEMLVGITRAVSPAIGRCELTHLARVSIDIGKARAQHRAYEDVLRALGIRVESLPAEPELPDSVFVEDAAVVLDECAVITRPGAASRQPETESIARALQPYRKLFWIVPPANLDGGDVMSVGRTIFVGLSSRSNQAAIRQLQEILGTYDYHVAGVSVSGCLHLKSAVTPVAADTLLLNPAWVEANDFPRFRLIEVDPSEAYAANGLLVGESVVFPAAFPQTRSRLEAAGIRIVAVDVSELAKAEGAVTCCSLIFRDSPGA
jgi:dimethylargininase